MAFVKEISAIFPGVQWTGLSNRHVSVAAGVTFKGGRPSGEVAFKWAYRTHFAQKIWNRISMDFSAFEFVVNPFEFINRAHVDFYRHAKGLGDTKDPTKLWNPLSGSVFHCIALLGPYQGGIRFWINDPREQAALGYRFRIEKVAGENEATTRGRARVQADEDEKAMLVIFDEIDLKEPVKGKPIRIKEYE